MPSATSRPNSRRSRTRSSAPRSAPRRSNTRNSSTLREAVLEHLAELQETADALATLDVLCGLAETARLYGYCRPLLNESRNLYHRTARHPVLDQNIVEEKFVPNDTHLEPEANRLLLITGPNMAGKSTYIRQVALHRP